jgi:hemerythrin superfamily protein
MARFSTSSLGAFVWGAMAGAIGSRLLPPLIAKGAGSVRIGADGDPFSVLIADHRIFESLLTDMEKSASDEALRRTQLFLRLKRRLAAHAMAEEDVVYPLLHDKAKAAEDAKHLYAEHADIKIHLYALETLPKNDPEWVQRASALKALIVPHARHEEDVDFPKLRLILSQSEAIRLAGNVQREKALVL